jgi:hypothetical protein
LVFGFGGREMLTMVPMLLVLDRICNAGCLGGHGDRWGVG